MEEIWKTVWNCLDYGRHCRAAAAPDPAYSLGFVGRASAAPPGITTLAKDHLRPAGQPGGDGTEVIAPGNRDARQLLRQRFFDQR